MCKACREAEELNKLSYKMMEDATQLERYVVGLIRNEIALWHKRWDCTCDKEGE